LFGQGEEGGPECHGIQFPLLIFHGVDNPQVLLFTDNFPVVFHMIKKNGAVKMVELMLGDFGGHLGISGDILLI